MRQVAGRVRSSAGRRAEDRPTDLGSPRRLIGGVVAAEQVVLTDWPLDGERVPGHVRGERSVGAWSA
jgi:hypothetical protein